LHIIQIIKQYILYPKLQTALLQTMLLQHKSQYRKSFQELSTFHSPVQKRIKGILYFAEFHKPVDHPFLLEKLIFKRIMGNKVFIFQ